MIITFFSAIESDPAAGVRSWVWYVILRDDVPVYRAQRSDRLDCASTKLMTLVNEAMFKMRARDSVKESLN